eukprot:1257087-Rhodomonas_salina.1
MKEIANVIDGDGSEDVLKELFEQSKEEVNVVRWFPPGVSRAPGIYFRLEDFLRTIPSKIRHDAVSRKEGTDAPEIKRPISSRLIRADPVLDERMPQVGKKKQTKIVAEYAWLVDFVFSMVYFASRWDTVEQRLSSLTDTDGNPVPRPEIYDGRWSKFESCMQAAQSSFEVPRGSKLLTDCNKHLKAARLALLIQIQDL